MAASEKARAKAEQAAGRAAQAAGRAAGNHKLITKGRAAQAAGDAHESKKVPQGHRPALTGHSHGWWDRTTDGPARRTSCP
jgi:uncharacterized protein YjbJ (UPF0337 family)